jgi:hypothetical protein
MECWHHAMLTFHTDNATDFEKARAQSSFPKKSKNQRTCRQSYQGIKWHKTYIQKSLISFQSSVSPHPVPDSWVQMLIDLVVKK